MVESALPTIHKFEQSEAQQNMLAESKQEDCLPCRVTGASAFIGLGAYTYFSGHSQLRAQRATILKSQSIFGMRSRQAGITSISLTLAAVGFWRLVN